MMEVRDKKILVAGMARSGIAAAALLSSLGAEVSIYDQKTENILGEALNPLDGLPIDRILGREPDVAQFDLVVTSPGIPLTAPVLKSAVQQNIPLIGELELAAGLCKAPIVAVTGTNGKTTTVTLLGEIFKNAGIVSFVVGNVGLPFTQEVSSMKEGDVAVVEVSSFQLETIESFHPRVSAILNITEDHLNRHGTMDEYIRLKKRIFENQDESEYVVLNLEDPLSKDVAKGAGCKIAYFSSRQRVEHGCCVIDGSLCYVRGGEVQRIVPADEIRIPGEHNLQNALAASLMALLMGVPAPVIRHTLKTFKGVEHRAEFVRELGGVSYINDSKGTNVDSSIAAVRMLKNGSVLIAGGYDKRTDFLPFAKEIAQSPIHTVVLIGETREQIDKALEASGFINTLQAESLTQAVDMARAAAKPGETVLFSPACASFDMFTDYEERGRVFKEIVNRL